MKSRWMLAVPMGAVIVMFLCALLATCTANGQCGPGGCPTGWGSSPAAGRSPGIFKAPRKSQDAPPAAQVPANAHPAVCRIKNDFGNGGYAGTGTLIDRNEKYGLIVTNEHLVRDGVGTITCKFPGDYLTAKVIYKSAKYDLCFLYTARPDVEPVEVALAAPQVGEAVKTCGYGSGDYREVSGTVRTYMHQDPPEKMGREFIRRGGSGELNSFESSGGVRPGDSGSPIFNRAGQLVGVMWGGNQSHFSGTPCTLVDQVALTAGRYLLPWNAKINDPARDLRNQPPAVQVQAPGVNVDIGPLNRDLADTQSRLDAAIKSVNDNRTEIDAVKARQDNVAKIAGDLADKYAEQLPGLSADVKTAIQEAADARAAAAAAKLGADAADSKASGVVGKVAEVAGKADDAVKAAEEVKGEVDIALDEDNPKGPLGKLRARIEAAKAEGAEGAAAVAKTVAMGVLQTYGVPAGIALVIIGFVVWDIRKKVNGGDPLLVEKVWARVHERLGGLRDRFTGEAEDPRDPETGRYVKRKGPAQ